MVSQPQAVTDVIHLCRTAATTATKETSRATAAAARANETAGCACFRYRARCDRWSCRDRALGAFGRGAGGVEPPRPSWIPILMDGTLMWSGGTGRGALPS